jgi:hypothetical protein
MGVPNLLKFKNTIQYLNEAVTVLEKGSSIGSVHTSNMYFESASKEMLNSKWHKDFINYDMQDNKRGNSGLLRSEYLSKVMREGKY